MSWTARLLAAGPSLGAAALSSEPAGQVRHPPDVALQTVPSISRGDAACAEPALHVDNRRIGRVVVSEPDPWHSSGTVTGLEPWTAGDRTWQAKRTRGCRQREPGPTCVRYARCLLRARGDRLVWRVRDGRPAGSPRQVVGSVTSMSSEGHLVRVAFTRNCPGLIT